jgi:hypothetical protein
MMINIADTTCEVLFVDIGERDVVSFARLSECPSNLKNISWQSIQIKFAHLTLNNDECHALLKHYHNCQLTMKIVGEQQNIYDVDLTVDDRSLDEFILRFRKENPLPASTLLNSQVCIDFVHVRMYDRNTNSFKTPIRSTQTDVPIVNAGVASPLPALDKHMPTKDDHGEYIQINRSIWHH